MTKKPNKDSMIEQSILARAREIKKLFSNDKYNLLLSVPLLTVLLPSLIHFPLVVPSLLLIPHLAYSGIFTASLLILFMSTLKRKNKAAGVHGQGRHESRIVPESGSAPI